MLRPSVPRGTGGVRTARRSLRRALFAWGKRAAVPVLCSLKEAAGSQERACSVAEGSGKQINGAEGGKDRWYLSIDLKSFYASVECRERGLDPLATNLVVADVSRTEKTICLAVSPSLKAYGIPGRARLFEVTARVKEVNRERKSRAPRHEFCGESSYDPDVRRDPSLALSFIAAAPRMKLYMEYSTRIYGIYLKYVAPEDIHVYSVDEVMIDATDYLETYNVTPRELAKRMILDIGRTTGITAAAGIGTNLYLAKVAMDIEAKHVSADEDGVRIAELTERSYREKLWDHRPLTDFWRVGRGYERKLNRNGLFTMGDIARCSLGGPRDFYNEDLLYKLFGVNAELLIDHAWGWEPCTIADIRAYVPENSSINSGQVLQEPYPAGKARLVVREMADALSMELVEKKLVTDQVVLSVGYDIESLSRPETAEKYKGPVEKDRYGRTVPKAAHGSENLGMRTNSANVIMNAIAAIYDRTVNPDLLIRRMYVSAGHVVPEETAASEGQYEQMDIFADFLSSYPEEGGGSAGKKNAGSAAGTQETVSASPAVRREQLEKEHRIQEAMLEIRRKYGKNAILRGMNLEEGATMRERNGQVGGHRAGDEE